MEMETVQNLELYQRNYSFSFTTTMWIFMDSGKSLRRYGAFERVIKKGRQWL